MNPDNLVINGKEVNLRIIQNLLSEGRKLEAMKVLMDRCGIGLAKSKEIIEDLIQKREELSPEDQVAINIKSLYQDHLKADESNQRRNSTNNDFDQEKDSINDQSLEDLLKKFKGKKITRLSSKVETLDHEGNFKKLYSSDKISGFNNDQTKKSSLYIDDSKAKRQKIFILVVVAIILIAYYLYQR